MKKLITVAVVILLAVIILVYMLGFYPIARVNGEFLWHNDFNDRARALAQFDEKARAVTGDPTLTPEERERSRQAVLENIIGQRILEQYAASQSDFSGVLTEAENLVRATLQDADPAVLPRAAKELYGWSVDEFRENVLYPQALQNVLIQKITESGADVEQFIAGQLAAAHVQIFFVPWEWRESALREKE